MNNSFSEKEINLLLPISSQSGQDAIDSKFSIKNSAEGLDFETIEKMKKCGILLDNKKMPINIYIGANVSVMSNY